MARIQIFRNPTTGRPEWAVIHGSPQEQEAAVDIMDPVAAVIRNVTGDAGPRVLVTTDEFEVEVV